MILSSCVGVFDSSIAIDKIMGVLKNNGYQGIELLGEPKKYNLSEIKALLKEHSLSVTALTACSRLKTGRDLASKDKQIRDRTIDHYKECLYLASELSTPLVGVTLTAVGRFQVEDDYQSELQRALESLMIISATAKKLKKTIIIETLNRYASFMMNTVDECKSFINSNHLSHVGICADLFHMNIEEGNLGASIETAGNLLKNFHISDNNRRGIGYGHLDFKKIYQSLLKIQYSGPLALEAWASNKNPYNNQNNSFAEIEGYLIDFSKIIKNLSTDSLD
ncbi:MAG: sugar phosphate isomerase/epimerase family protein [Candidatus Shapirobacteria bacterium]